MTEAPITASLLSPVCYYPSPSITAAAGLRSISDGEKYKAMKSSNDEEISSFFEVRNTGAHLGHCSAAGDPACRPY